MGFGAFTMCVYLGFSSMLKKYEEWLSSIGVVNYGIYTIVGLFSLFVFRINGLNFFKVQELI
jgi:hypothetical protein